MASRWSFQAVSRICRSSRSDIHHQLALEAAVLGDRLVATDLAAIVVLHGHGEPFFELLAIHLLQLLGRDPIVHVLLEPVGE